MKCIPGILYFICDRIFFLLGGPKAKMLKGSDPLRQAVDSGNWSQVINRTYMYVRGFGVRSLLMSYTLNRKPLNF